MEVRKHSSMTEAVAKARFVRGSAKKINEFLKLIRGKPIEEGVTILKLLNKPTKISVLKTLESAIANARNKVGGAKFEPKKFRITEARVDKGPMWKRYRAAAAGRPHMRRKRLAHITIKISDKED